MTSGIWIVGVGRRGYGDDAVGILVTDELAKERSGELTTVVAETGGGTALLAAMEAAQRLVVIDAAEASEHLPPGSWRRIDLADSADALAPCHLRDTHTLSVESLLRLGRALGSAPSTLFVYAIAGAGFVPETPPSPAVARAIPRVLAQIRMDIQAWESVELSA